MTRRDSMIETRLHNVRARHERNLPLGEDVIKTVARRLEVLPTETMRNVVIEALDALADYTGHEDVRDVAAALRWDRDGRPERLW